MENLFGINSLVINSLFFSTESESQFFSHRSTFSFRTFYYHFSFVRFVLLVFDLSYQCMCVCVLCVRACVCVLSFMAVSRFFISHLAHRIQNNKRNPISQCRSSPINNRTKTNQSRLENHRMRWCVWVFFANFHSHLKCEQSRPVCAFSSFLFNSSAVHFFSLLLLVAPFHTKHFFALCYFACIDFAMCTIWMCFLRALLSLCYTC